MRFNVCDADPPRRRRLVTGIASYSFPRSHPIDGPYHENICYIIDHYNNNVRGTKRPHGSAVTARQLAGIRADCGRAIFTYYYSSSK